MPQRLGHRRCAGPGAAIVAPADADRRGVFATADPETLLFTGACTEEPLDAVTSLFLDNEFGCEDVNKFASLAASARHVASLDGATGRNRRSSGRYRDIMRPLGLGDELRVALVVGSQCWGYLCLHRAEHRLGFTPSEAAVLARLGPHIAHALRQAVLLGGAPVTPDDHGPGVVLLADDLSVVAVTPEAEHLLSDHLKSVFDKVGVRSRRDLVGRLLGPAGCDRR